MKTAMPFAIAERKTEPRSESATRTVMAPASSRAGWKIRSGHHPVTPCVIKSAAVYTTPTYAEQASPAATNRPARTAVRPTGRTTSGCKRPRSASPRTTACVKKMARTVARKSTANMERPKSVALKRTRASTGIPESPMVSVWNGSIVSYAL
jgi:hypothetical protein